MFNRQDFIKCVADTLKAKGYGAKRTSQIIEDYKWRVADYERRGDASNDAATKAMADVYAKVAQQTIDKTVGHRKNLMVLADAQRRMDEAVNEAIRTSSLLLDGKGGNSPGVAIAAAIKSTLVNDDRIRGTAWESMYRNRRDFYWSFMSNSLREFSKGAFGRQLGRAHFPNVVRELFGETTGDVAAAEIAKAYTKVNRLMVEDFKRVGGAMDLRTDFNLPQMQNSVLVRKATMKRWIAEHMEWLDWDRMSFPDGDAIPPEQRREVLEEVYKTLATDGDNKIKPDLARGQGASIGNAMDNHRFLIYKNVASWSAMHETYGDGTVYDVIERHIDRMSRRISMVDQFGRNPNLMAKALVSAGRRKAAAIVEAAKPGDVKALRAPEDFEGASKRFLQMADEQMGRSNGDAESKMAASIHATSNIITSSLLSAALIPSFFGDFFMNGLAVRIANKMPLIDQAISTYIKGMIPGGYRGIQEAAARSGFIMDEIIGATYSIERWSGVTTHGPEWSRRVGDGLLRLGQTHRHTNVKRWADATSFMGMMQADRNTPFDKLAWREIAERYNITGEDWDVVRKATPTYTPRQGADFLRPIDIRKIAHADNDKLFTKFANMVDWEIRKMTPSSSMEARTYLRGGTTPNSLPGALMYSFSMFKNFPVSMITSMGRLGVSLEKQSSRVAFTAALGVGMIAAGALTVQMQSILKGQKPLPMNTTAFAIQSLLASGGLGIWGNYLLQGVSDDHADVLASMAGPLFAFYQDAALLAAGDSFAFMRALDQSKKYNGKFGQRAGVFLRKYLPGSRLPAIGLVLQREIWDRVDEWLDPNIEQKRRQRARRLKQTYGGEYYSAPGERLFTDR